jgi:hypothetical protein
MNLSQLITALHQIQTQYGDLPVHDTAHFLVERVHIVTAKAGEFCEDWNMPEGYKFVQIGEMP